eukprot:5926223-Pyramimonas_sp.AAC.1
MIASPEAIQGEVEWSSKRPGVVLRWAEGGDQYGDHPASARGALTRFERGNLAIADVRFPGDCVDLNQNITKRVMRTSSTALHVSSSPPPISSLPRFRLLLTPPLLLLSFSSPPPLLLLSPSSSLLPHSSSSFPPSRLLFSSSPLLLLRCAQLNASILAML